MDPTPCASCPTCDGTGEVWHDAYEPRRGHYTVETPCPDCAQAVADRDDEDAYERDEELWDLMSAYVVTKIVIKRVSHDQIVGASHDLSWVVEQYGTDADATYADRTEELLRISGFDSFELAVQFAYDLAPADGFPPRTEPKHVETPSNV